SDFKIPPEKKSIMDGPFSITALRWKVNAKEMYADFKIRYTGDGLGKVHERNAKLRTVRGSTFDNMEGSKKPIYLTPLKALTLRVIHKFKKGETKSKEDFYVDLKESLFESKPESFDVPDLELVKR
ncbi:MAG: hypothetical protein QF371_02600, partial [Flavobacteriales bacterium]|nr:hypothetical protein [Flavobacteriales bacterium]